MSEQVLLVERHGAVAVVTLNRPENEECVGSGDVVGAA